MKKRTLKRLAVAATTMTVALSSLIVNAEGGGTYTVKAGDSLSKIAKEVYGDSTKWRLIYENNRDKIKNPSIIFANQELIIPSADGQISIVEPTVTETTPVEETTVTGETQTTETSVTSVNTLSDFQIKQITIHWWDATTNLSSIYIRFGNESEARQIEGIASEYSNIWGQIAYSYNCYLPIEVTDTYLDITAIGENGNTWTWTVDLKAGFNEEVATFDDDEIIRLDIDPFSHWNETGEFVTSEGAVYNKMSVHINSDTKPSCLLEDVN